MSMESIESDFTLPALLRNLLNRIARRRRRLREERELRELPDHVLSDLGIGRSEIGAAMQHGLDRERGEGTRHHDLTAIAGKLTRPRVATQAPVDAATTITSPLPESMTARRSAAVGADARPRRPLAPPSGRARLCGTRGPCSS
jgi:uncharacterized protein YjiS (DUF1127 family)